VFSPMAGHKMDRTDPCDIYLARPPFFQRMSPVDCLMWKNISIPYQAFSRDVF
jgi:hypothetical protein